MSVGPDNADGAPFELGTEWLRGEGEASDVVMSSRARLARNIAGAPFHAKAARPDRDRTLEIARNWLLRAGLADRLMWVDLHTAEASDAQLLVERHLISRNHFRGRASPKDAKIERRADPRAVAVSLPDERLSIMVNEEDHLRIQYVRSGLALGECWRAIDAIDDKIEAGIDYAFSPRFGYLTACPTNVGTGLRMSVMLHLPALRLVGDIEKVKHAASDMNLAVRGFYGEGSESAGDLYQISNQSTLGRTEPKVVEDLERQIIPRVVEYERQSRRTLQSKRLATLEDHSFRALGVLTHARLLTTEEAMQSLSLVRLGVVMGVIPTLSVRVVNQLMLLVQPMHLQRAVSKTLDQDQRRTARAMLVRERIMKG